MSLLKIKPFIIDDTTASDAFVQANAAFGTANSAALYANAAFTAANNASDSWVRNQANLAFGTANSGSSYANSAFTAANTADGKSVTAGSYANSAFATANSAALYANAAFLAANNALDSWVRGQANAAFDTANSAASYANAAFTAANSKFNSSGGTISGDTVVTGNLTVTGTRFYANTINSTVQDNIITLNSNVTGVPTQDAGIEINRGSSTNTSIVWKESVNSWQFTNDGTNYSNIAASSAESYANSAFTAANTADGKATSAGSYANSAFGTANSAALYANAAFTAANNASDSWVRNQANGAFIQANAAFAAANNANSAGNELHYNTFTGDGTTTGFTLTASPLDVSYTLVNIDGVFQLKSAYTISGNTISFTGAPTNSSIIDVTSFANIALNTTIDTAARQTGNSALLAASTPQAIANSAALYANGAFLQANAAFTAANNALDSWVRNQANAAFIQANAGFTQSNTYVWPAANAAFIQANAAFTAANNASDSWVRNQANAAFIQANAAFTAANSAGGGLSTPTVTGVTQANEVTTQTFTITNYNQAYAYIISTTDGSVSQTANTVYWTMPAVTTNTTHYMTTQSVYTGVTSLVGTNTVLVVNLNITDTAIVVTDFSTSYANTVYGWVVP